MDGISIRRCVFLVGQKSHKSKDKCELYLHYFDYGNTKLWQVIMYEVQSRNFYHKIMTNLVKSQLLKDKKTLNKAALND